MVGGPWIVDAGFNSSIFLRNVVETSAVTITPILYLSNGAKYTLPDVQLQPSQTTTVDLNTALANLGIAPYATLSGYVELQYTWPWDPICATIRNLDTVHSLIFDYSFRPSKALQLPNQPPPPAGPQTNVAEGMWWKQEANVTGFVALANTTNQPIKATVDLSDGQGQPIAQHQVTISPHGLKTLALDELASAPTAEGGIRITYTGNSTDVLINGGLQDQVVGYSAVMPFTPASGSASAARTTTSASVAEIGLMSGPADPMMKFPAGIVFTPYSILRNVSSSPLTATPTLWWMAGGKAQSAQLPALTLAPCETRTLDVPAMLASAGLKNYSGNVNLVFDLQGNTGALLMAGGSVDRNNTYVFEVSPHSVSESASKSLSYWSTGNGNDTMVTLWNPTDEAQDLVFRLTFTGGHYLFPMHLDPRATQTFNISQVIQNQVPDSEGNVIPLGVNEGGAVLSGSQADNQHILVVMDAGTYNVKKATCGFFCQTCDGVTDFSIAFDPFVVAVGGHIQETMYATWDNGSQSNETSNSNWSSSNTSLATVSSGVVTGAGVGTPNITAIATTSEPGYSDICEGGWYSCPVFFTDGPGTTQATVVNITITGVGPSPVLGTTGGLTISGTNFNYLGSFNIMTDGGVIVGSAVVEDATTIQATYDATNCAITAGPQNLWIQGTTTDGGQTATNGWPISVVLPPAPAPAIFFNGNNVTGTTQSAVVGQQIALSASIPSLPACMSLSSQQWSTPPGTAVGGYAASTSSGTVTPLPASNNSSYTFYWVYPGSSLQMSYQYSMSGGGAGVNSPMANAIFNISGPSGGTMTTTSSHAYISDLGACVINGRNIPAGPWLTFGNLSGGTCQSGLSSPAGIDFNTPSGYSNSSGGNFFLVQLISSLMTSGGHNETDSPGLDSTYPYDDTFPSEDSPGTGPMNNFTSQTFAINANMFLMWQSTTSNSIPVPLGYQTWSFSGSATCSSSCSVPGNWTATTNGTPGPVGSFVQSAPSQSSVGNNPLVVGYPTWSGLSGPQ